MKPMVRTIDGDTVTDREMTDTEYANYQAMQADDTKRKAGERAAADRKAVAYNSGRARLTKLGFPADEIEAFFG